MDLNVLISDRALLAISGVINMFYSRNKVRGQGNTHCEPKLVCDTLLSQDACTHQI